MLPEWILSRRRGRIERWTGRTLAPPEPTGIPPAHLRHLVEGAVALYWDEWEWERVAAEESRGGGSRVERIFPGLLAFVEGLLVDEAPPDSPVAATPRPDVVEEIARFLAARCAELRAGGDAFVTEYDITTRLLDLVLYRLHALGAEEIERLEIARLEGDE